MDNSPRVRFWGLFAARFLSPRTKHETVVPREHRSLYLLLPRSWIFEVSAGIDSHVSPIQCRLLFFFSSNCRSPFGWLLYEFSGRPLWFPSPRHRVARWQFLEEHRRGSLQHFSWKSRFPLGTFSNARIDFWRQKPTADRAWTNRGLPSSLTSIPAQQRHLTPCPHRPASPLTPDAFFCETEVLRCIDFLSLPDIVGSAIVRRLTTLVCDLSFAAFVFSCPLFLCNSDAPHGLPVTVSFLQM